MTRNFINACGFVCYTSGAMEVALGTHTPPKPFLIQWFAVIGGVVSTTVQIQDLFDQAEDYACGRKTLPLVMGDWESRVVTVVPIVFWSWYCPWFWSAPAITHLGFSTIGLVILWRMLSRREVDDDKITFKIWNDWMVFLYSIPFLQITRYEIKLKRAFQLHDMRSSSPARVRFKELLAARISSHRVEKGHISF